MLANEIQIGIPQRMAATTHREGLAARLELDINFSKCAKDHDCGILGWKSSKFI